MPICADDPECLGTVIDIVELQGRNPERPLAPYLLPEWMKRDTWSRGEAIAVLAGYDPRFVRCAKNGHGSVIMEIYDFGYLDGLSGPLIKQAKVNWRHPRFEDALAQFYMLAGYSEGQSLTERKSPSEWIAWAGSKGFHPYWKSEVQKGTPIYTRERSSLLAIIRALSVMAKVDGRSATGTIERQLQELGFDSPKEKTIRDLLKEARELQP